MRSWRSRGLKSTVQFLGRFPDVMEYLGRADVIALTSISEAQPIALLEAAATGLPAVTTDVGSCREIIEGFDGDPVIGCGGIVVEACNPRATAEALAAILRNSERRGAMGRVMQQRIPRLYNKDRIRRLYEDLYTELAADRPGEATPAGADDAAPSTARLHNPYPPWFGRSVPLAMLEAPVISCQRLIEYALVDSPDGRAAWFSSPRL